MSNEQDTWKPPDWGKRGHVDSAGWPARAVDVGAVSREIQQMKQANRDKARKLGMTAQELRDKERKTAQEAREAEIQRTIDKYFNEDGSLKDPARHHIPFFNLESHAGTPRVTTLQSLPIENPGLMRQWLKRGYVTEHPWGYVRRGKGWGPPIEDTKETEEVEVEQPKDTKEPDPVVEAPSFPCTECGKCFESLVALQGHIGGAHSKK